MDAIADDADSGSFTEGAIARSCICIITAFIRGISTASRRMAARLSAQHDNDQSISHHG
jgi:hypothetical protein